MENTYSPKTLLEAVNYFSNDAVCVDFITKFRWADGKPVCPKCGSLNVCWLKSRPAFRCREKGCKNGFSLKTGSIMEDSPLPITKWVPAIWFVLNHKNGVSSCEVGRALGITQKSAWHLCHRIRKAISNGSFVKMSGTVEIDETHVGGKEKFKHRLKHSSLQTWKNRQNKYKKTTVMGMIERGGEFRGKVVDSQRRKDLLPEIVANIAEGATVYTDALASYDKLNEAYNHDSINHAVGQYVKGDVHTNTMENFWSCFKRSIKGTYIQVAPFHIDRYLDEQAFRYNYRKLDDAGRFEMAMPKIFGKRLTYAELTGKQTKVSL
jgi:transposase-like protein